MPRIYFIFPCVLTLLFGGVFWTYHRNAQAEADAIAAEKARVAQAEAAEQADAEAKARADAEQRAAKRAIAEAQAEAERQAKWQADQTRLLTEITELKTRAANLARQVAAADKTLADLQTRRNALRKANLSDGLDVERLRIAKSTAELELERLITLLARKHGAPDPALDLIR